MAETLFKMSLLMSDIFSQLYAFFIITMTKYLILKYPRDSYYLIVLKQQ